ncbi:TPR repeat-containing protein [Tolypothrix sp. NIES-4075]|uniref:CHAT domain-containing protein n=1 Tax=Tolypothrix sp. NIES-4075 TaxID=2005459 RepID=UPI000B5C99C1|nr:CHAT domain-containing protein [Tolypothrix sp. NIES-4075]GAX45338.1 TPR repeat-containing protein [Tolypothrix sp. NIES-4075]
MAHQINFFLTNRRTFLGFVHWNLTVLIGVLLLSTSAAATPETKGTKIALDQSVLNAIITNNAILLFCEQDRTSAKRFLADGIQLFEQGTLESRQLALKKFLKALRHWKRGGFCGRPDREAATLHYIGRTYDDLGDKQQALDYYKRALRLFRDPILRDYSSQTKILYSIANIERDRGNLNEARTQIEAAIKIIESLRIKIASLKQRTSYFASVQDSYDLYIDLLMQLHKQQPSQGYDTLALQISESTRARTLLEILAEAKVDIRQGVQASLLEKEGNLRSQFDALEQRRAKLLSDNNNQQQLQTLEKDVEVLLESYQQLQTKIRTTSPRYAALTQPKPLTLAEIQSSVLDENTLLLEYSLGKERSYLWAVTKTSITSYELPKRADIEAVAQQFYYLLKMRHYYLNSDREVGADSGVGSFNSSRVVAQLTQMLLQPVAHKLGNKRLLIVSDGALQYLPFAALPLPGTSRTEVIPLFAKHEIVYSPSASTLGVLRQERIVRQVAPKTLAVLADPVFSKVDERLQKTPVEFLKQTSTRSATADGQTPTLQDPLQSARELGIKFNRLTFTRQEAQQILKLVPTTDSLKALDFEANRAQATSSDLSQYRIVHFATHGVLNSVHPELSGLVLSLVNAWGSPQNGFLRLHDIFNLNLKAELVVLSACQTGLGQEVKGEGLIGLTRGFMYAGSPRVLVSLWNVDDEGTAILMQKFYSAMLKEGLLPAAAQRKAQLEMLQNEQWQSPYYWAGFVLQGEWK